MNRENKCRSERPILKMRASFPLLIVLVVVASADAASMISGQFAGMCCTGWRPPDSHGAAGPNGIIQTVNESITYWNKSGAAIWGSVTFPTFFSSVGATGAFDDRALYDRGAGRFYVIGLENNSSTSRSYVNLAVSKSSNPTTRTTADWYFYRVENTEVSGGTSYWGDYPGLGFDGQAVYVTVNMYAFGGGFLNCQVMVFNKAAITSGTGTFSSIFTGSGTGTAFTLQPASVLGSSSPGNVAYFAETPLGSSTTVRAWALSDPLGSHTLQSFSLSVPNNGGFIDGAPQSGTSTTVPTLSPRAQGNAFWYNGAMWFCHTAGGSSGRSIVYYYKVNLNGYPGGTPTLIESGGIDGGAGVWNYQPSIGANYLGDVGLVFSQSSSSIFPTIMYTTRLAGAGSFDAPSVIKASPAYSNSDRWGDYASVTSDPVDESLWMIHEWSRSTSQHDWGTWLADITLDMLQITTGTGVSVSGPVGGPLSPTSQEIFLKNAGPASLNWALGITAAWLSASSTNGTLSPGADVSIFVSPNSIASNLVAGTYSASLVFTNLNSGTTQVRPATLLLSARPAITNQPASKAVFTGGIASFTVGASGTAPLSYSWRRGGNVISGATSTHYTTNNVQLIDSGSQFSCVVNNSYGQATSDVATLTVYNPIGISSQPTDVTTGLGQSAAFSVTATGTQPYSYQWIHEEQDIAGATASSFTIATTQANDAGAYSVLVSNPYGNLLSAEAQLTVSDPYLTSQPQDQSVAVGATATFTVGAGGTQPLSYRWKKQGADLADGGRLSGAQTAGLTISNAQASDMGAYSVLVSNVNGSVLSASATLLEPVAPVILTPPSAQTVVAGSTPSMTVLAAGPAPFTYQWRKAGVNLVEAGKFTGTTNAALSIANVQSGEMANYSVVISNSYGAVTSADGFLSLFPLAAWGLNSSGQADIAPGLSNVLAIGCGGAHQLAVRTDGTVTAWGAGTNNTGFNSQFGQAIPPAGLSNVVAVTGGGFHSLALKSDGTVAAWGAGVINSGISPNFGQSIVPAGLTNVVAITAGSSHSLALKSDGTVIVWGLNTSGQTNVPAGLTNAVAVVGGSSFSMALRADGTVTAWGSNAAGQTNVPPNLTNAVAIGCGNTFGAALRADGTLVAWGASGVGQTNTPVGLSNAVALVCGSSHGLALRNDGTLASWGSNSQGQTNIPNGLTNVFALAAGGSSGLVLEGDGRPHLTIQPFTLQVSAGLPARLTALAVGLSPLSYQWQKNGVNVPGATNPSLVLASAQYLDSGSYALIVSNLFGSVTSATAVLTVPSAPVFGAQPMSQTVLQGASATFTASATGTTPLSYQWRFNGGPLTAATGTSFTVPSAQSADAGDYSVTVTNALGSVTSSNATLTVLVGPGIVAQPTNQTSVAGANVSFSVTTSGSMPLSYQWYLNQTNPLSGGGNQTLNLTNVQPADAGSYSVVVTNLAGSVASSNATLTVNVPPSISAQPQNVTTNLGTNVSFSVTATGTVPLSYQWRFNGADITAATIASYTRNHVQSADAGSYSVLVSNVAGTLLSADAVLTVLLPSPPHIDAITLLSGQGIELQVSGGPGNFVIDATPNLSAWTQLSSLTATGAVFHFTDPETNETSRFYRVRLLP